MPGNAENKAPLAAMAYLIGTDEAGYGPNLGPLVISATVWEVPEQLADQDLYDVLAESVVARPHEAREPGRHRVAMTDSKVLYQSGKGLASLERGLLAALALLDRRPTSWPQLWQALTPEAAADCDTIPWYAGYQAAVPRDADPAEVERGAAILRAGLAAAGVRLVELQSRAVFEAEFNRLVDHYGSKGETLSQATLALVAKVAGPLARGPIRVVCDKHGGRNRYQHLLAAHFPDWLIEVHGEGRQRSVYRFGPPERRVEFRFQAKAESYLPAALASMASKYLRELAMEAFNAFWCERVPGLGRTAGYPQDAKRFKAEIAATQAALGIDDRLLWRSR